MRSWQRLLVTAVTTIFTATFLLPQISAIVYYGRLPNFCRCRISSGMTKAEILTVFGNPHVIEIHPDGDQWYYWNDFFDVSYYGIKFSPDGLVIDSWS